jgi:hypothetical protein
LQPHKNKFQKQINKAKNVISFLHFHPKKHQHHEIPLDHVINNMGRTPLSLAAELGKTGLFEYLVDQRKVVLWAYGKIKAVAFPLDEIDPFSYSIVKQRRTVIDLVMV